MIAHGVEVTDGELHSATELLRELIGNDELGVFSLDHSPNTVYTTLATIWMLTLQRLGGGLSLEAVVRETLTHHRDMLPDNKRTREGTLSTNPSAYSEARLQLPVEVVERLSDSVAQTIIAQCPNTPNDRRAFILDGTTFKLAPTSNLREVYPPASNQHGETVWPILMLTVAHELQSGAALRPEFGAMYGGKRTSEARQAFEIAKRIPEGSIILADAGYGIFSVTYGIFGLGHDVMFRLTKSRFTALVRHAELLEENERYSRYCHTWTPSAKDRRTNPSLPKDACVPVEIHAIQLDNDDWLYVVTTMKLEQDEATQLYNRRYDVEHDIRDLKVTLGVDNIRAQSAEMVQKEMLCSMVAYNLVVQLRREAAKLAKLPPRRLSFKYCWYTMQSCLLRQSPADFATWQERYLQAIAMASKDVLPNRKGRSYPRRAHPKRPKSTKFMLSEARIKSTQKPTRATEVSRK